MSGNPQAASGAGWIVIIEKAPKGPLSTEEVKVLLEKGMVKPNDLALKVTPGAGKERSDWKFVWMYTEFNRRKDGAPGEPERDQFERRVPVADLEAKRKAAESLPTELSDLPVEDLIPKASRKIYADDSPATLPDGGFAPTSGSFNQRYRVVLILVGIVGGLGAVFQFVKPQGDLISLKDPLGGMQTEAKLPSAIKPDTRPKPQAPQPSTRLPATDSAPQPIARPEHTEEKERVREIQDFLDERKKDEDDRHPDSDVREDVREDDRDQDRDRDKDSTKDESKTKKKTKTKKGSDDGDTESKDRDVDSGHDDRDSGDRDSGKDRDSDRGERDRERDDRERE